MKISKNNLVVALTSIFILLVATTVLILQYAIPFDFMTHPLLNFLLILASGFGLLTVILGVVNKSPWFYFVCAILFSYVLIYGFCQFDFWYVGLIVAVVMCIIVGLFSFITAGNKTEEIALNDKPDYKDYKVRRQEKLEQEQSEEKKELPKIKSFKD